MIQKKVLNPRRIRKINSSFAFIEHRFRSWIKYLSPEELLLYFFLALAADEQGLSYYSPETIGSRLQLSPDQYYQALNGLITRDLVTYQEPLFQVLSLPERGRV
jgi:hypothetical protein